MQCAVEPGPTYADSAWSTSTTGRRAAMRVGMAVRTPMAIRVATTIVASHSAEGGVAVPLAFGPW